mmetsp:Transcript_15664/g.33078  ORF Transcript_15664/g.33078 Transcript_15664/m.33078 type:complete len:264 (-) Transcript_15664:366-1157(-)
MSRCRQKRAAGERRFLTALMLAIAAISLDGVAVAFSPAPLSRQCIKPSYAKSLSRTNQFHRRTWPQSPPLFLASQEDNDESDNDETDDKSNEEVQPAGTAAVTPSEIESMGGNTTFLSNIKNILTNKSKFNRESLGKLGVSALLAYGFVSNVSGIIAVSCAWFIFSKRTGLSPLGNKPAFLAVYAGFTVMLNIIRPARFAFSISISPYFERIRKWFSRKFGVSPRGATVLMIIFINLCGSSALMVLGVGLASLLSGVPVWSVN